MDTLPICIVANLSHHGHPGQVIILIWKKPMLQGLHLRLKSVKFFFFFFRALALRLNARVSELTLAAECARTDGESARAELQRVRERHDSEVQALEKRQKQLVSALRAVGGQAQPLDLAQDSETRDGSGHAQPLAQTDSGRLEGATDALMAVRDRNQSQAIQEAELAVAVMQVVHDHFRDSWCDAVSHFPTAVSWCMPSTGTRHPCHCCMHSLSAPATSSFMYGISWPSVKGCCSPRTFLRPF